MKKKKKRIKVKMKKKRGKINFKKTQNNRIQFLDKEQKIEKKSRKKVRKIEKAP